MTEIHTLKSRQGLKSLIRILSFHAAHFARKQTHQPACGRHCRRFCRVKDQGAFTKEVCRLYAKAAVKGSREGALLLTQCVNQSYTGTASDRRILLAALYLMAGDVEVNGIRASKQLENLRLTETEKAALAHFDIKAVLDGTVFVSPMNMGRLER